jgi:hypothetical protein
LLCHDIQKEEEEEYEDYSHLGCWGTQIINSVSEEPDAFIFGSQTGGSGFFQNISKFLPD